MKKWNNKIARLGLTQVSTAATQSFLVEIKTDVCTGNFTADHLLLFINNGYDTLFIQILH